MQAAVVPPGAVRVCVCVGIAKCSSLPLVRLVSFYVAENLLTLEAQVSQSVWESFVRVLLRREKVGVEEKKMCEETKGKLTEVDRVRAATEQTQKG